MPSPHTLGSIMHQPLAALTPLLLFPLENRTSTHPPQYAREPPRIPLVVPPPLSLRRPPQPPSRRLPPRRRLSRIRAPVKYSGNHSPPPPSPAPPLLPSSESYLRSAQRERKRRTLVPSRAHDFCHPFPSSIFFAAFLCLSRSLFPFSPLLSCSSPLPCPHFSLARSSGRDWSRLRRDFRLFFLFAPHLPPPPSPPPSQRSSSFGVRTLFVVSPLLFVLLQPTRFITAVLYPLHTDAHILSLSHTHTQKHLTCVSLSPTIFRDPSSSFLNPARVLLSLPFVTRLPRVFSLTIAQKIPPS